MTVDSQSVSSVPAAMRAIGVASQAVAKLELGVWRGKGIDKRPVTTTWQARFFSGTNANPYESWFLVKEQTEASLTARNNAYWLKIHDEQGRVAAVYVIHPDDVVVRWNDEVSRCEYRVRLPWSLKLSDWLDAAYVLHFRVGYPRPGSLCAPSPIELHREALGSSIAKTRYEAKFYDKGIAQSLAVIFPRDVDPDSARRYKEALEDAHGGLEGAFGTRVFGGGADVKTIGLSLKDAQYIESMRFSVEEIARIFGVQVSLIGGGSQAGDKPITPEHEEDRWLRYGLSPRLSRIEETILADPSFFGPGARDYPMFDTAGVLRGDLKTEAEIEHMQIQDGTLLPDEARRRRGQPPLPGGVGMIPQVVPVGGAPNPVHVPTPDLDVGGNIAED